MSGSYHFQTLLSPPFPLSLLSGEFSFIKIKPHFRLIFFSLSPFLQIEWNVISINLASPSLPSLLLSLSYPNLPHHEEIIVPAVLPLLSPLHCGQISPTEDDFLSSRSLNEFLSPLPPTLTAFSSFSLIGRYFLPHNGTRLSPLLISSPPFPPGLFLPGLIQPARSPASQLEQIWGTTSINLHPARESQYQASPCAP